MTYASALTAGAGVQAPDAVLVIDGIPVAFATRAGLTFNRNGDGWLHDNNATLTTVAAIDPASVKVDGSTLDFDQLMVPPGSASLTIRRALGWDRYFERRRTPVARLTADLAPASATINVDSSIGYAANGVAYIDRECVFIGGTTSTSFTTCLRAYYGIPGQMLSRHRSFARVTPSPLSLVGRHAELWFHIAGNWRLERRLRVDGISRMGTAGTWDLSFVDIMAMIDRQIAVGMDAVPFTSVTVTDSTDTPTRPLIVFNLANNFGWFPSATSAGLFAHVKLGEGDAALDFFTEVLDADPVGGSVTVSDPSIDALLNTTSSVTGISANARDFSTAFTGTIKLVLRLNGPPMLDALRVITSTGSGSNGSYDVLFGVDGTTASSGTVSDGTEERRFGAAISDDLVDVAGLADYASESAEGWSYWLGASGQENLRDFLEEVAWALQGYWCIREGKLTFRKLSGITGATPIAATILAKHIEREGDFKAIDDEREAVHSMAVKCNLDPVTGTLMGEVNIRDMAQYETFRDVAQVSEVERRGLTVVAPQRGILPESQQYGAAHYAGLVARFDKMLHRRMRGLRKYELTVPFRFHTLEPGDVVSVTTEALPDFAGGSLDSQALEVVSTSGFSLGDGKILITGWDTWRTRPISVSGNVASWSGGPPQVITLDTSHRFGGGTTPGRQFAVGWKVRLLDKSATPPFATASAVLTVSAVADATVTVTGVVGFTPAAGDILVQANYDDADNTTENTAGYAQRDYAFEAESGLRLGTADDAAHEWG